MNAIQFIKEHGIDKAREVVEGAPVVIDGTDKPFTATHYNYHPRAPIEYINNDGTVIPLCIMEVNFPSYWIDLSDLKRLVESVVLIESYKGIDEARWYVKRWFKLHSACKQVANAKTYITDQLSALQQAIADYEAIYL